MAEVKYNKKHVFGENDFRVTTGDADYPERYFGLQHDTTNAVDLIGNGSKVTNHLDPIVLADNGYFDLPADSAGHGFFFLGDGDGYAEIIWDTSNTVTLITNTTNVNNTDIGGYFCFFDNTSSVRVKNRTGSSIRVIFEYEYTETIVAPSFKLFDIPAGVDNLDPYLTINGTTVTPTFRYKGGDASASGWTAWDYGSTLSKIAGSPTYSNGSPGLGSNDDSIFFAADTYYQGSGDTGYITTEDFVIELIFQYSTETNDYLIGNWNSVTSVGWLLYTPSSGSFRLFLDDTSGTISVTASGLTDGAWYHLIAFGNRNENSTSGCSIFINGASAATGNISTMSGSLAGSDLTLGAAANGVNFYNYGLAYAALWTEADWHQASTLGPAEWSKIAAERFARFSGYWPEVATNSAELLVDGDMETAGTAAWNAVDSTLSKDTTAPLYEGTQHLRVTSTADTFWARQTILQASAYYRITGAARSVSGSAIPRVLDGSPTEVWIGTTSTSWQEFDVVFQNVSGTALFLGSSSSHPGVVDFDDVSVTLLGYYPTANTRAFSAYLDKVEGDYRKLYYVGGEWLRMCHRVDSSAESVRGYLAEIQSENLFTYSEAFTNWTKYDAGDVVADDAAVCPDGRVAASSIVADTTNGFHGFSLATVLTAATYTFSVFAKPGDRNWIQLLDTTISADCYFDISNGEVGTATSCTGYIEGPFYGDYYRCCIVITGTAASNSLRCYIAEADGDSNVIGDSVSVNTYFWGAQVELSEYMTSPVITSGSTQTRLADQLQFVAKDNIGGEDIGQGTIALDFLFASYSHSSNTRALVLSDGGDGFNRIAVYVGTSDRFRAYSVADEGNDGSSLSSSDDADGLKHAGRVLWGTDSLTSYVDSIAATTDTDCGMPNDIDELDVGQLYNSTQQFNGLISNLRIYSTPTLKG